jgi:hypothetical protein
MRGNKAETWAIGEIEITEFGLANASRIFQHRLKYWLQFAGRGADDFQHL